MRTGLSHLLVAPAERSRHRPRPTGGLRYEKLPVAARADAVLGRTMLMRPDTDLEMIEYRIEPDQYLAEWFELAGSMATFLISVEIEGVATYRLQPRDLIAHSAALRHRWNLVDNQSAHVLLVIAHPPEGTGR